MILPTIMHQISKPNCDFNTRSSSQLRSEELQVQVLQRGNLITWQEIATWIQPWKHQEIYVLPITLRFDTIKHVHQVILTRKSKENIICDEQSTWSRGISQRTHATEQHHWHQSFNSRGLDLSASLSASTQKLPQRKPTLCDIRKLEEDKWMFLPGFQTGWIHWSLPKQL